jgi:Cytidylate kinase
MSVLRLDDVLAEVMEATPDSGMRIIGVDGPSGSGKSTLATRISARIGAPLVQIDDFVSWVDLVGWWPRFETQVLNPLLSGNDAHFRVRDWENDEFGTSLNGWKTVEWSPVVVSLRDSPARDPRSRIALLTASGSKRPTRSDSGVVWSGMGILIATFGWTR